MSALGVNALTKSFGGLRVTTNVNLTVAPGERRLIIGPNGAGKTTLFNLITGEIAPDSGSINLFGRDITRVASRKRAHLGLARTYQIITLFSRDTILRNVTLALRKVLKKPRAEAEEIGRRALAEVGLADKPASYPAELSGGQQQRVAIARALALGPKIVLFDEPTSALDPELVGSVLAVMRDLKAHGMTMLVVSHELRFARDAADRIVFMDMGRIVEEGPPSEVFAAPRESRTRAFVAELMR